MNTHQRRKRMKPKWRARMWTHQVKDIALSVAGHGLERRLHGRPGRVVTAKDVQSWLEAPAVLSAYDGLRERMRQVDDERRHSMQDAECFALFALTRAVAATRALEIGTHLGFSTLNIAAGLTQNGVDPKLTSVDMIDVNDEARGHFRAYGATMSARQRLRALSLEDRVEFVVSTSDAFLKRAQDTYDFIFVDGEHSEPGAYFDILQSLLRLSERGIIVLHDYNDPDDPTPGAKLGQYGVHWAIQRLRAYIPDIGVIRLRSISSPGGEPPVPTSLAIVTRRPADRAG
jgi:predicted O-methyltransferase YrrM